MPSLLIKIYSILLVGIIFLFGMVYYTKNTQDSTIYIAENVTHTVTAPATTTSNDPSLLNGEVSVHSDPDVASVTLHTEPVGDEAVLGDIDVLLERNYETTPLPNPCTTPVTYTIGQFDTRFGITKSEFVSALANASKLWNDALGKNIFSYSDNGVITVNLIYDERQANTERNHYIAAEIKNTESVAKDLKSQFEALGEIFSLEKDLYLVAVESFTVRQKAYNDTVHDWNQKGGAPKGEYDALISQKEALQRESDQLLAKQNELNALLVEINKKITRYNELVLYANSNVARGNSLARKKFTEGQYIPQYNQIDIYQFSDRIKLHRVLTHEFGHVFGIEHVENKESIMYGINSGSSTILSKEDLDALYAVCNQN